MADGGLAAHLGRPPVRAVRRRARSTRTASSGRSAGGRPPQRDLAAFSPATIAILEAYTAGVNAWLDREPRRRSGSPILVDRRRRPSRGRTSTRSPGPRSRPGTWASNLDTEIFRYLADARLGDPARTDELFPPYPDGRAGHHPERARRAAAAPARIGRRVAVASTSARPGHGRPDAARPRTQAAAWRTSPRSGARSSPLAGLDARAAARDRRIARDRLERLGRRPGDVARAAARCSPTTRTSASSMPSIWIMNGLHCRDRLGRLPVRRGRRQLPGRARRRPRPQRPRSPGAPRTSTRTSRTSSIETVDPADPGRYLTSRRVAPVHDPPRGDQASAAATPSPSTSARPSTGRSSTTSTSASRTRRRWPCAGPRSRPRTTRSRPSSRSTTAADFDDFRTALSRPTAPRRRTSSTPTSTGTSATSSRASCRSARTRPTRALRPVDGADGRHEWIGRIPFDDLPVAARPEPGWIVTANNAPVDATTRYRSATEWDPGYRAQRIIDLLNDYGQDGVTVDELGQIQMDGAPLRARDVGFLLSDLTDPGSGGVAPTTADGALIRDRIDTLGRRLRRRQRRLRGLHDLGVPRPARHLRRRARPARARLRRLGRVVAGRRRPPRRPERRRGGTTSPRPTSSRPAR